MNSDNEADIHIDTELTLGGKCYKRGLMDEFESAFDKSYETGSSNKISRILE